MWGAMGCFSVLGIVISSILTTGCATLISGRTQEIRVRSNPPGATVTVEPSGEHTTTPGTLSLRRSGAPYRLLFELQGHTRQSVMLTTSTNAWVWANLLIGIVPGAFLTIVDSSTGAELTLTPDDVDAQLPATDALR